MADWFGMVSSPFGEESRRYQQLADGKSATNGIVDLATLITNPAFILATAHVSPHRGNSGCGRCWYRRTWVDVGAGELNTSADSSKPFVPAFGRRYTADQGSAVPDLLVCVSKQQVARLMQRATQMQQFGRVSILLLFQVP